MVVVGNPEPVEASCFGAPGGPGDLGRAEFLAGGEEPKEGFAVSMSVPQQVVEVVGVLFLFLQD
jgi:hypothetical protein